MSIKSIIESNLPKRLTAKTENEKENDFVAGYNASIADFRNKIPEIEKLIIEEVWEMRECARNDGQIQHLATYDDIIKNLTS